MEDRIKDRIKDHMEDDIVKFYKEDIFKRNKYLNIIISLLNKEDRHFSISLDGRWGSGKTVFLKQLEYLANRTDIPKTSEDEEIIKFKDDYIAIYFDSWSYDKYDDPLLTILYLLINQLKDMELLKDKVKETIAKLLSSLGYVLANTILEKFGIDSILDNYQNINAKKNDQSMYENIMSIEEKIDLIGNSLNEILGYTKKKRILFIMDELDRCNPNFAISLLEITKHIFISPNINCIFGINKFELSKIISHYYGDIDSITYLDKIFNYSFNLPIPTKIHLRNYIEYIYTSIYKKDIPDHSSKLDGKLSILDLFIHELPKIFNNANVSLREINFITSQLDSIRWEDINYYRYDEQGKKRRLSRLKTDVNSLIFIYLCILKTKDYLLFYTIISDPMNPSNIEVLKDNVSSLCNIQDRDKDYFSKISYNGGNEYRNYKKMIDTISFLG
ncbi:KAP family P-loop NTPase fold protein [Catellicoccus marimammalium]|uniref:Putative P-loop ATPase n=1 Tax=Catellicoccus marimammalium M35/04/3 TaxID=1234409 RepID=K8ZNP6_9ENTE|nr:P-loop NTPase fold protein [Catellicoccus marimammalium]EKU27221.1 putative P-loop ATPase [Catellicoccus marimammalium M35/04/3]